MAPTEHEDDLRNIDRRLDRIEQILPTLATKAELDEKLAAAVAPLATKAELRGLKVELIGEIEASRRQALVLYEDLRGDIRLLAESQAGFFDAMREQRRLIEAGISRDDALDFRVTALEHQRRPPDRGPS